ncbi:MAG: HAMP domain-containing protein [Chloroflexi bacterium]|nr:HAMP domain-containing protein [Chloroflexota bacterium]
MNGRTQQPGSSITGLRGGLGRTLLTAFLLLAIVPLGINAWLAINYTGQEMRRVTQEQLDAIVTIKIAQMDGWLAHQDRELAEVSAILAAEPATSTLFQTQPEAPAYAAAEAQIHQTLTQALQQQDGFRAFQLVRITEERPPADPLLTVSRGSTDDTWLAYREALIPNPGEPSLGLLVGYLDAAPLIAQVEHTPELQSTGRAYLVTADGVLLGAPDVRAIQIPTVQAGDRGSALYQNDQGQPVAGAYGWYPALSLTVVVEQSQHAAFAPAENLATLLIANTLVVALLTTVLAAVLVRRITRPIVTLTVRAVQIAEGDFWQAVPAVTRRDEIGILAQAFTIMTEELRRSYEHLQNTVTERTKQLQEANRQLQRYAMRLALSAEIGRIATAILDPATLLEQTTRLICESYGFAHVGIFLLDETGQAIILRSDAHASPDEAAMIPRRVLVGDGTVIGQSAADGQAHLTHPTPTRVELAVPLRTGPKTRGVLAIYTDGSNNLIEHDIRALQSLGDQICVAIVNAETYAQEQETTRKLRQLEHLRVQSFGSISHELATALNSIIGFSRLILKGVDGPLTDLQRTDLTAIHQSGHHLLSMMDNVLDLVELERGTVPLNCQPTDVAVLIDNVLTATQNLTADRLGPLLSVVDPDLPTISCDADRLLQVLIHLIAEATESAETVMISASLSTVPERNGILIRIASLSIETATLPSALTVPIGGDMVWDEEGASLGLALSKRIVELHEGRFWTQVVAGGDRIYAILLPVAPTDARPIPGSPPATSQPALATSEMEAIQV